MPRDMSKESKQAGIHQSFSHQSFVMVNSPKFSPAKISRYTVLRAECHDEHLIQVIQIIPIVFIAVTQHNSIPYGRKVKWEI